MAGTSSELDHLDLLAEKASEAAFVAVSGRA